MPPAMVARLSKITAYRNVVEDAVNAVHWRTNPDEMGGGPLADIGAHVTDLMLWLAAAGEPRCCLPGNGQASGRCIQQRSGPTRQWRACLPLAVASRWSPSSTWAGAARRHAVYGDGVFMSITWRAEPQHRQGPRRYAARMAAGIIPRGRPSRPPAAFVTVHP